MPQTAPDQPPRWYLVQTKPGQVKRATDNLLNQGYRCFHPLLTVQRIRRGRVVGVEEPMFPNYVFIHLRHWTDRWAPIRSTRGVIRLVAFGGEPTPVPDEVVAEIQARDGAPVDGLSIKPGDRVRVTEGCFATLEPIFLGFDGEERVMLLLDLMNKQTKLKLPLSSVEPVG